LLSCGALADAEHRGPQRERLAGQIAPRQPEVDDFVSSVMEVVDTIRQEHYKPVSSGEMVAWAIEALYDHVCAKVPLAIARQLGGAGKLNDRQARSLLGSARTALGKRKDLQDMTHLTATIEGMLRRHDPETIYTPPEKTRPFICELRIPFSGVGVQLGKDAASGRLRIVTPIKDGPAHQAGLYAGDRILAITQRFNHIGERLPRPQRIRTARLSPARVKRLAFGPEDTTVTLTVQRPGRKKPFNVTLHRRPVDVESVLGVARKNDANWDYTIDHENRIGYVRLPSFDRNTGREMKRAMTDLKNQGVKGLILDLRFNPGGLLTSAIDVVDLFITRGTIVSIQPNGGPARAAVFSATGDGGRDRLPVVCLVNAESARASELVAAALQDYKRAFIVGERSQGKANIQNIMNLEVRDPRTGKVQRAQIQFTTADLRRPSGQTLHKGATPGRQQDRWGVVPNKVVALTDRECTALTAHWRRVERIERPGSRVRRAIEDRQLGEAVEYLRDRMKTK
jgi:carboxyl-terminal processing protease